MSIFELYLFIKSKYIKFMYQFSWFIMVISTIQLVSKFRYKIFIHYPI